MLLDSLASIGVSLFRILRQEGIAAMRAHWKQTAWITVQTVLWVTLTLYGPVAIYSVARSVYDDHQFQVSTSAKLAAENSDLANKLKDAQANAETRCEQAKGREIRGLKRRLSDGCYLPDRHLTEWQKDELSHSLKQIKKSDPKVAIIMICTEISGDVESFNLMTQFHRLFRDAEWEIVACDQKVLEAVTRNAQWRGIVVTDSNRGIAYATREIQNKLQEIGFEVEGSYPLPEGILHNTLLMVGYKVGYNNLPFF
jgi:hypothetical protein